MLSQLLNRTCTITRRVSTDEFDDDGEEIFDETEVETVCEIQQLSRQEQGDQGELSDTLWRAIFPPGAEIDTGDAVTVDGETFELIGDPWPATNPRTGQQSHIEATARRTGVEVGS